MRAPAAPGAGFEVRVEPTVEAIDPATWDALVPADEPLASHRFVRLCERADIEGARYRHVVLRDARGTAAVAAFCAFPVALDALAAPAAHAPAGLVRRVAPHFLRPTVVFGGLPPSLGRSCLRLRADVDAAAALAALAEVAEGFADDTGAALVCFKEFTASEGERLAPLEPLGYLRAESLPGCRLDLATGSLDGWLDGMRSGYRRQVRTTWRAGERAGLVVGVERDFAPLAGRIHALYDEVMDGAPVRIERLPPAFFAGLAETWPGACRAVLAELDGRLVGAALLLVAGRRAYFLLVGFDHAAGRAACVYPNLVAAVVAESLAAGCTSIELGQTSYPIKFRLGGVPTARWIFLRGRSRPTHAFLRAGSPVLFPARPLVPHRVFRVP